MLKSKGNDLYQEKWRREMEMNQPWHKNEMVRLCMVMEMDGRGG